MIKDYLLAFNQIKDPRFWKPVICSTLLSSIILILFLFLGSSTGDLIFEYLNSYFDFLEKDSWVRTVIKVILAVFLFILGFFFFNSIHAGFLGLFMDGVIDAVNEKHYPSISLKPAPKTLTSAIIATRLVVLSLVVNLIATPIFIIGWFLPPIGIAMQLLVNGYLLGKEYQAAIDQRLPSELIHKADSFTLHGSLGTAIWLVPILNLFAPVLVCASIFHARAKETK